VFERWTAGWKSLGIRQALHSAKSDSSLSVLVPDPRSDADLTLKFHAALYVAPVAPPLLTSKFRPYKHTLYKHQDSPTLLSPFSPEAVSAQTFFPCCLARSAQFTLPFHFPLLYCVTYPYHKDDRTLNGNFVALFYIIFVVVNMVSVMISLSSLFLRQVTSTQGFLCFPVPKSKR